MKKLIQELNGLKIKINPSEKDLERIQEIESILEQSEETVIFDKIEEYAN